LSGKVRGCEARLRPRVRFAQGLDDAQTYQQYWQQFDTPDDPHPENDKTPENRGFVNDCQALASAGVTEGWAIQDSNL
jgi:hypothetical protein